MTHLVGEPPEDAEFAVRLEPEDAERRGNHVSLSLVIRRRDALVGAVALHRVLSAGQLVGQHAADRLVQDPEGNWVELMVHSFDRKGTFQTRSRLIEKFRGRSFPYKKKSSRGNNKKYNSRHSNLEGAR